jgi:hypothetical protein
MLTQASAKKKKVAGSVCHFPGKLQDMMEYVEANGLESAISWMLHGRGFQINDPEKLLCILPLFFGQTKYRSFRRQLNMWHFERIQDGPNKGVFIHPYFVKDNKALCSYMSRQVSFAKLSTLNCPNNDAYHSPTLLEQPNETKTTYGVGCQNSIEQCWWSQSSLISSSASITTNGFMKMDVGSSHPPNSADLLNNRDGLASFAGRNFFAVKCTQ